MAKKIKIDKLYGRSGRCPFCGQDGQLVHIYKDEFNVCPDCKVYWPIGYGLFSSWQEESEKDWLENISLLSSYKKVKPVFHDEDSGTVELPDNPKIVEDQDHKVTLSSFAYNILRNYSPEGPKLSKQGFWFWESKESPVRIRLDENNEYRIELYDMISDIISNIPLSED